ncbi:hypothetical protein [Haloarcula amylovorans]|uniref:hypothetical protein n=1 Tax=Haloarcula amylovorans TaxID=2562280 RepID=UPI001075F4ED|nr:hypothetical protein [Halomicroarcula amylolytica]
MVSPRYAPRRDAQYARFGTNDALTPTGLLGYLAVLAGVLGFLTAPVLVGVTLAAFIFVVAAVHLTRRLDSPVSEQSADRESRPDSRERLAD